MYLFLTHICCVKFSSQPLELVLCNLSYFLKLGCDDNDDVFLPDFCNVTLLFQQEIQNKFHIYFFNYRTSVEHIGRTRESVQRYLSDNFNSCVNPQEVRAYFTHLPLGRGFSVIP